MRIQRKKLWDAIKRYADAQEANSWKGGGNPEEIPEIVRELKRSRDYLRLLVSLVIPVQGIVIERKD